MDTPTVLLVHKLSKLQLLQQKRRVETRRLMQRGGPAAEALRVSDQVHRDTVEAVKQQLAQQGLKYTAVPSLKARRAGKRYGLVLSVGGDGTFLDAARVAGEIPILGVNSDPRRSIGRFCATHKRSFGKLLRRYLAGEVQPLALARLHASINGSRGMEALNDLLVTASSPAMTSHYVLKVPGQPAERQRSSGMWITTAAGSTAAIRSAGGRVMPLRSRRLQYLVREPYRGPDGRDSMRIVKGFIPPEKTLTVESRMADGRVYPDGGRARRLNFRRGEVLRVSVSSLRCLVIGLS